MTTEKLYNELLKIKTLDDTKKMMHLESILNELKIDIESEKNSNFTSKTRINTILKIFKNPNRPVLECSTVIDGWQTMTNLYVVLQLKNHLEIIKDAATANLGEYPNIESVLNNLRKKDIITSLKYKVNDLINKCKTERIIVFLDNEMYCGIESKRLKEMIVACNYKMNDEIVINIKKYVSNYCFIEFENSESKALILGVRKIN